MRERAAGPEPGPRGADSGRARAPITVPTQILDGDCQLLLDEIEASVDLGDMAHGTLGCISCAYYGDRHFSVDALPREQVSDLAERYQQIVCGPGYDSAACRVAVEAAANWVLVTLGDEPSPLLEEVAAVVHGAPHDGYPGHAVGGLTGRSEPRDPRGSAVRATRAVQAETGSATAPHFARLLRPHCPAVNSR